MVAKSISVLKFRTIRSYTVTVAKMIKLRLPSSFSAVISERLKRLMDLDVVVCAKNRAEMLNRILRQIITEISFQNLIVIYGSSKDETKQVAERYTRNVFWDEDKGLGAARNLGIERALQNSWQ